MKAEQINMSALPVSGSVETWSGRAGNSKPKVLSRLLLIVVIACSLWVTGVYDGFNHRDEGLLNIFFSKPHTVSCAQVESLQPLKHNQLWKNLSTTIGSSEFQSNTVDWLGNAVRIP